MIKTKKNETKHPYQLRIVDILPAGEVDGHISQSINAYQDPRLPECG
jgi:hypothetical protein